MEIRWKKLSKASCIEITGSLLLLLCMFLPWLLASFEGMNSVSISFRAIMTDMFSKAHTYIYELVGYDTFNYGYLLFLFPVLCLINIVTQYFVRVPWLSFYTAVAAAFTVISTYFYLENIVRNIKVVSDVGMGIGAILAGIISLLMMICSWTSLGFYYKKHLIYLVVALIWCIVGYVMLFCIDPSGIFLILCALLGIIHAPFLIYALLVAACSYFVRSKN